MTKGFGISERDEKRGGKMGGSGGDWDSIKTKKMMMKRNVQRLGGRSGLSLESFANAKTRNDSFNPALISTSLSFPCIRAVEIFELLLALVVFLC